MIDGEGFFDTYKMHTKRLLKYEEILTVQQVIYYITNFLTTGKLFDYDYFSKHYKLIVIDFSKLTELENPDLKQQINFIGRLDREDGTPMFFIIERSEETIFTKPQN